MSEVLVSQEKSLYTFFDLLSDVGGLMNMLVTVFSIILGPYNHSLFLFNTITKLFEIEGKE